MRLATLFATGIGIFLALRCGGSAADYTSSVGRIEPGARIVALGGGRQAPACASCHGFDGNADPSGAFPRLAGQNEAYLRRALDQYASGERTSPIMSMVSKSLDEQQRGDVSAYYASLRSPVPPSASISPAVVEKGRVLATVGSNDEQIPACTSCHGPFGRSVESPLPSLSGQYAAYIVGELEAFSKGARELKKGPMGALAHSLTRDEMEAVGAYFQRQSTSPSSRASGIPRR